MVDLACHGLVDQRYGNLFGALVLTPGQGGPKDDGWLTLAEAYELDLGGCELVVLSACETNVGPEQRGEGVWSLARGFLAAGSRRVVASSWLLEDASAASMVSYMSAILAEQRASGGKVDVSRALQEAKRWTKGESSEHGDWHAPYYWAPMVLVGAP